MKNLAYKSWLSMRARCRSHKGYADRGITICSRWNSFDAFLDDMGQRPSGTTLDRIDNNGNYEPGNCRWATNDEQHRNRRRRPLINDPGIPDVWLFARQFAPNKCSFKSVLAAYSVYCDANGITPVTDRRLANAMPVVGVSKRRRVYIFDAARIVAVAPKNLSISNPLYASSDASATLRDASYAGLLNLSDLVSAGE